MVVNSMSLAGYFRGRRRFLIKFFFLLSFLFAHLSFNAYAAQVSEFRYNNWTGGAYTSDVDNSFSHCVVSTSFKHGGSLYIGVLGDGRTGLGFSDDSWSLKGGAIEGFIQVDDRYLKPFDASSDPGNTFYVFFSSTDPIFESIRRGRTLSVEFDGRSVFYDLTDTARALTLVRSCVNEFNGKIVEPTSQPPKVTALDLWISENPWFREPEKNAERYALAMEIYQVLLSEGLDPSKIIFYAELDRRLRLLMKKLPNKKTKELTDFFTND